jgi:transcriptional regulator with GAF, ATPase, and Fis domain/serine/threonine protein kinase
LDFMKWIDKKYELIRSLGGGGFSDVYLVKTNDGRAALKLLKTEITLTPNEKTLVCFKNEFSILKNLNHPNIARILDFGLDEELMQYYFTSEFVEGTNIYNGTDGTDIETIIRLFAQALRALEYLHSYRTFHFDIKAGNILLTTDGKVKLIDFGLASIDPKGKLMGTPSYMPPEIIRKEKPDGRADIYSLGVLWYYCLARKNPFKSTNSRVTIENQKSMVAPPPSKYNPRVPEYIDQIIGRMLEKRPEKRYERASQIIRELNLLGNLNIETETSETLLSYIPEKGRFIGRKDEIGELSDTIDSINKKKLSHRTFLIVGKNGTGKKRLLDEIRYIAQINDMPVESADGHSPGDVEAWLDKIDEHLNAGEGSKAFILYSAEWLEVSASLSNRIKSVLAKIPAYSKRSATLLAIGLDRQSELNEKFNPLIDKRIELRNFDLIELREYLTSVTGLEDVPDFMVAEIFKRTEGNPLFVTEISKSLITSGALFGSRGRWDESSFIDLGIDFKEIFPKSLKGLLLDNYHDLSEDEKKVLESLSVVGKPSNSFELATWTGLKNISPLIEKLIHTDILIRKSVYEYFFRNELLSRYIYDELSAGTKESLHDKIAEHLISLDGSVEEIVRHLGFGSDHRKAFEETFKAGCKHLKAGMGRNAIDNFSIAMNNKSVASIEELIELSMKTGEAYLISQNYEEALNHFNTADDLLINIKEAETNINWHVDSLLKIGGTYIKLHQLDKARKSFATGKELLSDTSGEDTRQLTLENFEGYLALQEGNIDEAEKIYSRTRELRKKLSPDKQAQVTNNELGMVLLEKGELEKAVAIFEEDLEYYKTIKDELLIARRYYNLAQAHQIAGKFDKAIKFFQKTAEISRETKDIELLFCAYNGLGNIYNITSNFEESRKFYERARSLSFRSSDFKSHAAISINIGIIENKLSNTDLAYYELSPATIFLKNTPHKSLFDWQILGRGEMEMAEIMIKKGDIDAAEEALKSAKESASHFPEDETTAFWLLWTQAHLHKERKEDNEFLSTLEKLKKLAKTSDEYEAITSLNLFLEKDEEYMENLYHRILEINKLINSENSVSSVLKTILRHAIEISGAETAAIALTDASGELNIVAHRNVDESSWNADISHSFAHQAITGNKVVESENAEDDERFAAEESIKSLHLKSVLCLPIHVKSKIIGALYLDNRNEENAFQETPKKVISIFTDQIGIAISNAKKIEELSEKSVSLKSRVEEMSSQLKRYEAMMDESVHGFITEYSYENIIGHSKPMSDVLQTVDKIMKTDISVLITGDSGTGKELIAKALHFNSPRKEARFVTINCGAIPANLMESELFGYKAGAFTGAVQDKKGLFEEANGGTIFLDEVTEVDPSLQVKMLRVIQEKEFHRVGDTKPRTCDVRIVSATNKDIAKALESGQLREDLYWRLCQLRLHLPSLRERKEDIPLLVKYFLSKIPDKEQKTISPHLLKRFIEYDWPGNIRELENLVSVAAALSKESIIDESCIPKNYGISTFISEDSDAVETSSGLKIDEKNAYRPNLKWQDYEKVIYAKVYLANNFKARKAASELHVAPTTMYNKIKLFHLDDKNNSLYNDSFEYTRGHSLKSYEYPIFKAALKCSQNKASKAISKLGISQGFFYKVTKNNKAKTH